MDWITFILICLVICIIWVILTQIWMNSIDMIISLFKKLFRINKHSNIETWHTLEDIKNKTEDNPK